MTVLLAHNTDQLDQLRKATPNTPLRVLVSGCLVGWNCGVDGTDYGLGNAIPELLSLPNVQTFPFCPEQHALGTPRTMPDIHGGDGFDVLAGRARVLDENGNDLTEAMLEGAHAMLAFAQRSRIELAILTDMSAACGTQVVSDACRLEEKRRYRWGVGVAAAMLLRERVVVVSQRDFATLGGLRRRLDPTYGPSADLRDHHLHPWVLEHLPARHPRADFGVGGRDDPGPYPNVYVDNP